MFALMLLLLGFLAAGMFLFAGVNWPPLAIFGAGLLTGVFLVAALWTQVRSDGRGSSDGTDTTRVSRHPHPYERGRWSY